MKDATRSLVASVVFMVFIGLAVGLIMGIPIAETVVFALLLFIATIAVVAGGLGLFLFIEALLPGDDE